jgi:hypothetical protein
MGTQVAARVTTDQEGKVGDRYELALPLDGIRPTPQPFVYQTLGMMGSLGHSKGFGKLLKVRVRGFPAWFIRRTYYLLQVPGWGRKLRVMIDWTFALLFRPDVVKVGLDSETALLLREVALGDAAAGQQEEGGGRTDCLTKAVVAEIIGTPAGGADEGGCIQAVQAAPKRRR